MLSYPITAAKRRGLLLLGRDDARALTVSHQILVCFQMSEIVHQECSRYGNISGLNQNSWWTPWLVMARLVLQPPLRLAQPYEMPMLGYGTFRSEPGVVKGAVLEAIKAGYRHLDLAHVYGNEKEVGQALKEAFESKIVTRGDLFLVGKLWNSDHDVDIVPQAYQKSCDDLGVEYLDLYLIHFPVAVNHTGLDNPNFGPGGG